MAVKMKWKVYSAQEFERMELETYLHFVGFEEGMQQLERETAKKAEQLARMRR